MKTIKDLNTKHWYRLLKVLYVLIIIITGTIIYNTYYPNYDTIFSGIIEPLLWVLFILEIFKRAIYYIYFGTITPQKAEMNEQILKIKNILNDIQKGKYNFSGRVKIFFEDINRIAQNEVDNFENKDSRKDSERILSVYNLMIQAGYYYHLNSFSGSSTTNRTRILLLYYAQELEIDIDSIDIEL
jgi:hypothetical protein